MTCPKCLKDDVTPVGTTHYICNNPECSNNGTRTQFHHIVDDRIRFPFNQIFINRSKQDFFRKPYIALATVGDKQV